MVNLLADEEDQVETNRWYIYNKGSNHMTRDGATFKDHDEKLIGHMKLGDKSIVPIQCKWSVLFQCKNDNQCLLKRYITSRT